MSSTNPTTGTTRFGSSRIKRAAVLLPLALLSAAWTVSISTSGVSTASADDERKLPDGTNIPAEALTIPASVTTDSATAGVTGESAQQIISTASASEIPAAALAAYQRAETVINKADPTCRLPWQLVAAIGRIESNHGRAQGNTLTENGVATPGIFGLPLNGENATAAVADTDAGRYDGDPGVDRAVGPMQFIPSTWSTIGVDADGDGQRNPQDINDAALAAAVYLCSGDEDLSTDAGQRAAALRYNHSTSYVTTVMSVFRDYLAGDFNAIPNYVLPATYFEPAPVPTGTPKHQGKSVRLAGVAPSQPSTAPSQAPAASEPGVGGPSSGPTTPGSPSRTPDVVVPSPPAIASAPSTGVEPLDHTLTKAQATAQCLQDFGYTTVNGLLAALTKPGNFGKDLPTLEDLTACVAALLG